MKRDPNLSLEQEDKALVKAIQVAINESAPVTSRKQRKPSWTEEGAIDKKNAGPAFAALRKSCSEATREQYRLAREEMDRTIEKKRESWREKYVQSLSTRDPTRKVWNTLRSMDWCSKAAFQDDILEIYH